ncbi:hypothetical protein ACIA8K_12555 [Catenuloplanes sp. NPDC051500]|uniref:hypothetical protein n=1 Tax=Catenuloplanes sp. NPDC051500 TaxID=3363959 RepID=UPI00379AA61E
MREIATTDGLAILHIDHETMNLWVDFLPEHTAETTAEVYLTVGLERLYVMTDEEMPAEPVKDAYGRDASRFHLAYTEVFE